MRKKKYGLFSALVSVETAPVAGAVEFCRSFIQKLFMPGR